MKPLSFFVRRVVTRKLLMKLIDTQREMIARQHTYIKSLEDELERARVTNENRRRENKALADALARTPTAVTPILPGPQRRH